MTEQFRVNRPFGNGSTVHGNVLSMLAPAVLVYYLRKALLSHTTLSGNQYRQVGGRYLDSDINGTHQRFVIADDAKT